MKRSLTICLLTLALVGGASAAGTSAAAPKPVSTGRAAVPQLPPGWLDTTFGTDGTVQTPIGEGSAGSAVAVQTDGAIVVAGSSTNAGCPDVAVVRYLGDGSLDGSFGTGGIVTTTVPGDCASGTSVALQTDGDILVGASGSTGMVAVRYLATGILDPSFGTDGIFVSTLTGEADLSLLDDGSILLGGADFTVTKLTSGGIPDTSFGGGDGIASLQPGDVENTAYSLAVQADGAILVGGYSASSTGATGWTLVRFLGDGTPDPSFDGDGATVTASGDRIRDVAVQPDGGIVVAGDVSATNTSFAVGRFATDGSLDPTFDTDGIATVDMGGAAPADSAFALTLQQDGAIVAAGTHVDGSISQTALVRLLADGSPDDSFGTGGVVLLALGTEQSNWAGVALQDDGKVVTTGAALRTAGQTLTAGRFLGQPVTGPGVPGDFNGDGYADLAVGVPNESLGTSQLTGAVNVIWGSATGLSDADNQLLDEQTVTDTADAPDDGFGWSVAPGDFNGDGFSDLAVGAPFANVDGGAQEGLVFILYGGPTGLSSVGGQVWSMATPEAGASWGWSLATGDFDQDSFGDLAIGAPGAAVGTKTGAGEVGVIYGSAGGLSPERRELWSQNSSSVAGTSKTGDGFGWSVAAGDSDGDQFSDLAVGVPYKDVGTATNGGAVVMLMGSGTGLSGTGSTIWEQDTSGISEASAKDDWMGYAVAMGDVNGDGFSDLVAGVPYENVGSIKDAGGANLLLGSAGGLSATGDTFWNQDHDGVSNTAEIFDNFATSVATGDFDSDGLMDVAFGVPGEDLAKGDQGAVNVLRGSATGGLTTSGQHLWTQDSTGIKDTGETGDLFGSALAVGDFGNGTQPDLAIGVVLEDVGSVKDAGAVNVLYGGSGGLSSTGNQYWNQKSTGILDSAETEDWFSQGLGALGAGGIAGPAPRRDP